MGYLVEITEHKVDKMSEYVEDMLWAGGRLMNCIEEMKEGHSYGHRDDYSKHYDDMRERTHYGMRGDSMRYRDHEEWDDDDMAERRSRRRRDSRGRYM